MAEVFLIRHVHALGPSKMKRDFIRTEMGREQVLRKLKT
jgi:hypothetical protein